MLQDPDFVENLKKSPPPPHYSPDKLTMEWYAGFLQGQANFFTGLLVEEASRYGCTISTYFTLPMVLSIYLLQAFIKLFGQPGYISYDLNGDIQQWKFTVMRHQEICKNLIPIIDHLPLFGQQKYNYAVFKTISTNTYIRRTYHNRFTSYNIFMCIRNRYIQQYVVQPRRKQKGIYVNTIPKILNAFKSIDYMQASKWRYQVIQVGGKKQFGEDFVVGLVDASGSFYVDFKLFTHAWPVVKVQVYLRILGKDYGLLKEIQHKIDNDVIKEIIPIAYKMNSNQMRMSDRRNYTQEQLIEYLDTVPTRKDFVQLKPQLQKIKEDLKQKWKNQKTKKKLSTTLKVQNQINDL